MTSTLCDARTHTNIHTYTHRAKSVRDKMGKEVENVTAVVKNTKGIPLPDSLQTMTHKV